MIGTISTFSSKSRLDFGRRLLTVTIIVLAFQTIVAPCANAAINLNAAVNLNPDINLADIVCWQCDPAPDAQALAVDVRLTILPQLVGNDQLLAKRLGFNGVEEVNPLVADIDFPFVVFRIGIDRLKNYDPLHDPASVLLDNTNWVNAPSPQPVRFLFPIKVGNKVRSGVMLSLPLLKKLPPENTKWGIQWIGSPNIMTRVAKCGDMTGAKTCDGKTYFIVSIPALNRYYLGRFELNPSGLRQFKLTVLFKDRVGHEGQELSATTVFQKLKPEALEILKDPYSPPR